MCAREQGGCFYCVILLRLPSLSLTDTDPVRHDLFHCDIMLAHVLIIYSHVGAYP